MCIFIEKIVHGPGTAITPAAGGRPFEVAPKVAALISLGIEMEDDGPLIFISLPRNRQDVTPAVTERVLTVYLYSVRVLSVSI